MFDITTFSQTIISLACEQAHLFGYGIAGIGGGAITESWQEQWSEDSSHQLRVGPWLHLHLLYPRYPTQTSDPARRLLFC